MPRAVGLYDEPRRKDGLSEYPKFVVRTVTVPEKRGRKWKAMWLCSCGNSFEAYVVNVVRGHTTSCGCEQNRARRLSFPIHGHFVGDKPSPTYVSWQAMIARCTNENHPAYSLYGGRGVTICDRWKSSFANFLADMGERPEGMTLDRVNPFGNYEPGNCRWADWFTQRRNRRDCYAQAA